MDPVQNIRHLMALDFSSLNKYSNLPGKIVHIPAKKDYYVGTRMDLLPKELSLSYMEDVTADVNESPKQKFKTIARLIQEDLYTKRIDFYSKQVDYSTDKNKDSIFVKRITTDIRSVLQQHNWIEKKSGHDFMLIFQYGELEMTIMLELLEDREFYPFWYELHAYPSIVWPPDHIPDYYRYIHFVVRKKIAKPG
jgi:hypothetical protein